jgi:anti-sigma B factor antagonist
MATATTRNTPAGPCRVIGLAGEADLGAPHLADILSAEVAGTPPLLIIDLSHLTFMDSWALTTILRAAMTLRAHGGTLALASPTLPVQRLLELTDAAQVVRIHPTISDATSE